MRDFTYIALNSSVILLSLLFMYLIYYKAGKILFRVKRNVFRTLGYYWIFILNWFFFFLRSLLSGEHAMLSSIAYTIIIICSIFCVIKGEGVTSQGLVFSFGFIPWKSITGFCWRVFCKYFFPKVAKYFSIVLQLDFPQCCNSYFSII